MSKMNFIIWSYLDGLIRVEETNMLLKTYTHRSEERSDEAIYSIAYLAHLSLLAWVKVFEMDIQFFKCVGKERT